MVLAPPRHAPNKERLPPFVYGSCVSSGSPPTSMGAGRIPFARGNTCGDAACGQGDGREVGNTVFIYIIHLWVLFENKNNNLFFF